MPNEPLVEQELKSGTLRIWNGSGNQMVFAVIKDGKDILRGTMESNGRNAKFFLGSADKAITYKDRRELFEEAELAITVALKGMGHTSIKWPKGRSRGFAIVKKKPVVRPRRNP